LPHSGLDNRGDSPLTFHHAEDPLADCIIGAVANRTHAAHQALLFQITLVITTRELVASIKE